MPRLVILFGPNDGLKTKGQHLAAAAETLSSSKPLKRFRKGLTL